MSDYQLSQLMKAAVTQFSLIAETFQGLSDRSDTMMAQGASECVSLVLGHLDGYGFTKGKVSGYLTALYKKVLIQAADCLLSLTLSEDGSGLHTQNLQKVSDLIEASCLFIQQGEKDELRVYMLAFRLHAAQKSDDELRGIFEKIISSAHITSEELLDCFSVLALHRLASTAIFLGQHLLKACEKHVVDRGQQKRFILKFLFLLDQHLSAGQNCEQETLQTLIETLGRLVSLEFLKQCSMAEVKLLFYSTWNVAWEAKEAGLVKECNLMLRQLYETVKRFSQFFSETNYSKAR